MKFRPVAGMPKVDYDGVNSILEMKVLMYDAEKSLVLNKDEYETIMRKIIGYFPQFEDLGLDVQVVGKVDEIAVLEQRGVDMSIKLTHEPLDAIIDDWSRETILQSFKPFCINSGIPINNTTFIVYLMLHELGHLDMEIHFYSHGDLTGDDIDRLRKMQWDSINFAFGAFYTNIVYSMLFTELYADKFAYLNLPGVYKMLVEEGLV